MNSENIINTVLKIENKKLLSLSIEVLDLSPRVHQTLIKYGIETIGNLVDNWRIVPSFSNIGNSGVLEITGNLSNWYQKEKKMPSSGLSTNLELDLQSIYKKSLVYKKPPVNKKVPIYKKSPVDKMPQIDLQIDHKLFVEDESFSAIPIEELGLSIRAFNSLKRNEINTVYQVCTKWEEIRRFKNVGAQTYKEIQRALTALQNSRESAKKDNELFIQNEESKEVEIVTPDFLQYENNQSLHFSIDALILSPRVERTLFRNGINTMSDIVKNWEIIPNFRNMGDKGVKEIIDKLNLWLQREGSLFLSDRPLPVIDPVDQSFDEQPKIDQIIDNQSLSDNNDNFPDIPIEAMDLPIRAYNVLKRNDIETVGQILANRQKIASFLNVGPTTLEQIQNALAPFESRISDQEIVSNISLSSEYNENHIKVNIRILGLNQSAELLLRNSSIHTIDQITSASLGKISSVEGTNPRTVMQIYTAILDWLNEDENRKEVYFEVMKGEGLIARPEEIGINDYLNTLFMLLNPRHFSIIDFRFGLRTGDKTTLEETAKQFGVTRERIRQIESQSIELIRKRITQTGELTLFSIIKDKISARGGVISETRLIDELQNVYMGATYSIERIMEFINKIFDGEISLEHGEVKIIYVPTLSAWSTNSYDKDQVLQTANKILEILSIAEFPMQWRDLFSTLVIEDGLMTLDENLAHAIALCMSDTQQIQRQTDGSWSKFEKTTRYNRIISVLRQIGRPAHFSEISEIYNQSNIDLPLSKHNIHSILSSYDEFVRVGRGKYGLPEWGLHDDGNVSNAVRRILADHKHPMNLADIINEVLKTWDVQNSAVIAAIDGDARFSKTEDGKIWLTETGLTLKKKIKRDDDARWDRLLIVLREIGNPSPVSLVVDLHNKSYPERPLTIPAVRGMMFRKPELFVRTGQDEFGLAEWDLEPFQETRVNHRAGEILRIFQQKPRLHIDEVHSLYNELFPEKQVSMNTIRIELKKLAGIISNSSKGIYQIEKKVNIEPSDSQHNGRFERILKIFIEMNRPSRVPPILERYNLLYPADAMTLEGFMEYLMYIKNHPEKHPALYEDKQLASS